MKNFKSVFIFALVLSLSFNSVMASQVVSIDDANSQAVIEINGVQYKVNLDQPLSAGVSQSAAPEPSASEAADMAELERQFMAQMASADKYTGYPATQNIRIFTQPTDKMMKAGHFGIDFTHRFSGDVDEYSSSDLWGLDSFAYNAFGVHYGLSDWAEIHGTRGNVGDMYELGFKVKLLRETKKLSLLNPANITLHTGFQHDNLQNSIDPYIQLIMSRSIIPNRLQVFFSPIYAFKTNSIAAAGSDSAIYFPFIDDELRSPGNEGTFALPMGMVFEIVKNRAALVGEIVPVPYGYQENQMGWSFGLSVLSKRETHIWTMGVSNMPYITTGQSIVGGPDDSLHLGFNVNIFL